MMEFVRACVCIYSDHEGWVSQKIRVWWQCAGGDWNGCTCVCTYVCMYACMHVCMHVYICVCIAYMHVCEFIFVYVYA